MKVEFVSFNLGFCCHLRYITFLVGQQQLTDCHTVRLRFLGPFAKSIHGMKMIVSASAFHDSPGEHHLFFQSTDRGPQRSLQHFSQTVA
jgi:hypothetical protein